MKRWLQGSLVFVVTLVVGYGITRVSVSGLFATPPVEAYKVDPVPIVAEQLGPAEAETEFKNVSLPEEFESGDYREFQPVFEGADQ